jgi:nucleoside transporter
MAEGVAIGYAGAPEKPPLDMSVRVRLSIMMFLQFAVWGSWFVVFGNYCLAPVAKGGLGFDGTQTGSLIGTMALGAIVSMMFAGQLADRVLASEYLMAIFHILGAVLLYVMAEVHTYGAVWWAAFGYALLYNPTLAIANSLAFANIPDATRDFPTLRVLGTIGWIVAGLIGVDVVLAHMFGEGVINTNKPLLMAAILSVVLGLFSLALPHTPPSGKHGDALPFLRAFKLLLDPSFGIFFGISFVITIALAFYYGFAGPFLASIGVKAVPSVMTIGQGSEIFFMLMLPFALKRFGMKGVLIVGMAAWAARYGFFSLGYHFGTASFAFALVIIGVALHGVCFDFFLAAGFIHTDNKAPASIRGSAQALFSFLTYGVGMWLGNVLSGVIVDKFTDPVTHARNWSAIWAIPAIGAAVCLVLFIVLWQDRGGKVEEIGFDPVTEISGSPKSPDKVSQTIA